MFFQRASGEIRVSFFLFFGSPDSLPHRRMTRVHERATWDMELEFDFPMPFVGNKKFVFDFFLIDDNPSDLYLN